MSIANSATAHLLSRHDINYYRMLLKKNLVCDYTNFTEQSDNSLQMEHSYSRDWRPMEGAQIMTTRTILIHRPPQCPSCHVHAHDEDISITESYNPPIPTYNEEAAKDAMDQCTRLAFNGRNMNSDDVDWESKVVKFGWSEQQDLLFDRIVQLLDLDHMARLANKDRGREPVMRRVIIDKSVSRLRLTLASVSWETRLTQWLHNLLMDNLPPSYMAIYLDILQTLKSKLPTMVDKMMYGRPIGGPDTVQQTFKDVWQPEIAHKCRKLPGNTMVLAIPPPSLLIGPIRRLQHWYNLFATMANVIPVKPNISAVVLQKQSIQLISDQIVALARTRIQEIRNDNQNRSIVMVGFGPGSPLALQVALVEQVSSIVCMGFSYNTIIGVRGAPDDRILDITTPILFVLGQNSARSSQEEIESLREKMQAQTSLVVVGCADDYLRISKSKRKIEGVTQLMVDNMILDEVAEFCSTCIINPPGPRKPTILGSNIVINSVNPPTRQATGTATNKKRKVSGEPIDNVTGKPIKASKHSLIVNSEKRGNGFGIKKKLGRPRIRGINDHSPIQLGNDESLDVAVKSILPAANDDDLEDDEISTFEIIHTNDSSQSKLSIRPINQSGLAMPIQKEVMVPANQFVQIKPPIGNTQKVYTLKTSTSHQTNQPLYTVRAHNSIEQPIRTNKIITVRSTPTGTHLLPHTTISQSTSSQPVILNPPSYTIIKPNMGQALPKILNKFGQPSTSISNEINASNIFDIPIVFADKDGNIQDTPSQPTQLSNPPIVLSSTLNTDLNKPKILLNNILKPATSTPNKVVFINRNQMKPVTNLLTKIPPLKYPRVGLTSIPTTVQIPQITTMPTEIKMVSAKPNIISNQKIELFNKNIVRTPANRPILINVDSDKTTVKNIIKISDAQIKSNNIVIKPNSGRPIPILRSGILNRNLTVRKVNIISQAVKPRNEPGSDTTMLMDDKDEDQESEG